MTRTLDARHHPCDGKVPYPSTKAARRGLAQLLARTGASWHSMEFYPCPCVAPGQPKHWHVGHRVRRRGRKRRGKLAT